MGDRRNDGARGADRWPARRLARGPRPPRGAAAIPRSFLIVLALITIARAATDAGVAADWLLIAAAVILFGLIGRLLWRRSALAAKLCYSSDAYYSP
jgi:hypothetical protein